MKPERGYWLNHEIKDVFGKWVSDLGNRVGGWDWWVTLTFKDRELEFFERGWTQIGQHYADKASRDWLRFVKLDCPHRQTAGSDFSKPFAWIRGTEFTKRGITPHFHLLVAGCKGVSRIAAGAVWKSNQGFCHLDPYNEVLGAGFYLTKYAVKEIGNVDFSPAFPQ